MIARLVRTCQDHLDDGLSEDEVRDAAVSWARALDIEAAQLVADSTGWHDALEELLADVDDDPDEFVLTYGASAAPSLALIVADQVTACLIRSQVRNNR